MMCSASLATETAARLQACVHADSHSPLGCLLISPFVTEPGKRNYLPVTVPSLMSQFTSGAGFFSSLAAISLPFASVQDKSTSGSWEGGVFILCVLSSQLSL